jgi:HD superfamily phosphodiesterase
VSETLRDLVAKLGRRAGVPVDPFDLDRLSVPDTRPCREAERICREASTTALANHCFRSYAWGVLLGSRFAWDAELLYAAAMLHDVGLTPQFDRGGCFESDGAEAAREILAELGWPERRCETAAQAIYLHMRATSEEDSAEARLLALGTAADVTGRHVLEIADASRLLVLELFPREDFKREFAALFEEQARRKPGCVVAQYIQGGIVERILAAPFDS